jgi:glycosyltransferase involved in cell wall biosynthesis
MNSTEEIKISIALVTRNRPESLVRCLKSWRSQIVQPFEILISDDSDDSIRPEIQSIARQFTARWIPGPRRGLYANRNHVARQCQGTHLFSADDDHEHSADLLEKCLVALQEDPNSAWCLGEVCSWDELPNGWGLPGELQMNGASDMPADISDTWAWSDGATLCPRGVFDSGLDFCEAFRFGASYLEFGCLLHSVGWRIRILRSTGVIHHMGQVGRSYNIPVEERAATYFAVTMLAVVYQPGIKNSVLLVLYFVKEMIRRPRNFAKAFAWALRERRKRTLWLRQWLLDNRPKLPNCHSQKLSPNAAGSACPH